MFHTNLEKEETKIKVMQLHYKSLSEKENILCDIACQSDSAHFVAVLCERGSLSKHTKET